jgi:hypothetical protein
MTNFEYNRCMVKKNIAVSLGTTPYPIKFYVNRVVDVTETLRKFDQEVKDKINLTTKIISESSIASKKLTQERGEKLNAIAQENRGVIANSVRAVTEIQGYSSTIREVLQGIMDIAESSTKMMKNTSMEIEEQHLETTRLIESQEEQIGKLQDTINSIGALFEENMAHSQDLSDLLELG